MGRMFVVVAMVIFALLAVPAEASEPRMANGQGRPVGEIVYPRVTLSAFPIPMGTLVQYVGSSKGEPALKWGDTIYVFPQMFVRYYHGNTNYGTSGPAYVGVFGTVKLLYEEWLSEENRWSGYFETVELEEPEWTEAELRLADWASVFAGIMSTSGFVAVLSGTDCKPVVYMDDAIADEGPYTGTYYVPRGTKVVYGRYPDGCRLEWNEHHFFVGYVLFPMVEPIGYWDSFQLSSDPNPLTFCWMIQRMERIDGSEEDGFLQLVKSECAALAQS